MRFLLAFLWCVALPGLVSAGSVEVAGWKDLPFCQKMAKFFGERLAPDAALMKTVEWMPIEVKGQGPKTRHCSTLDRTLVDLDNDGTKNLVVKTTFCMRGAPSDSLYVFPADSTVLEKVSWQDLSPLLSTQDKFERTGGTYPLLSLQIEKASPAPILMTLFSIQPFLLEGVAYVGLTDARREWMAIAKYRGGQQFEDQCYLHASKS